MTTPNSPAGSQQAAVDAALVVLKSMDLSLGDLTAAPLDRAAVPTFADYVPVVSGAVSDGTRAPGRFRPSPSHATAVPRRTGPRPGARCRPVR
jgi:hypothetical protein